MQKITEVKVILSLRLQSFVCSCGHWKHHDYWSSVNGLPQGRGQILHLPFVAVQRDNAASVMGTTGYSTNIFPKPFMYLISVLVCYFFFFCFYVLFFEVLLHCINLVLLVALLCLYCPVPSVLCFCWFCAYYLLFLHYPFHCTPIVCTMLSRKKGGKNDILLSFIFRLRM